MLKKITHSINKLPLALFCISIFLFCFFINGCKNKPKKEPVTSVRSDQIVAPAVMDSVKDTIRASVAKAGIIQKIYVNVGDHVNAGDPLLLLDNREEQLAVAFNKNKLDEQKAQLSLEKMIWETEKRRRQFYTNINDVRAISKLELNEINNKVHQAALSVERQKKQLGAAQDALGISKIQLNKNTLVAHENAIVLQIQSHVGEFVQPSYEQPTMLLGDFERAYVRVAIDARDVWKFKTTLPASIKTLGDENLTIPLTFLRVEHYAVNKAFSLSQFSNSMDSQALEVVYYFNRSKYSSLIPGEQFDAYIG